MKEHVVQKIEQIQPNSEPELYSSLTLQPFHLLFIPEAASFSTGVSWKEYTFSKKRRPSPPSCKVPSVHRPQRRCGNFSTGFIFIDVFDDAVKRQQDTLEGTHLLLSPWFVSLLIRGGTPSNGFDTAATPRTVSSHLLRMASGCWEGENLLNGLKFQILKLKKNFTCALFKSFFRISNTSWSALAGRIIWSDSCVFFLFSAFFTRNVRQLNCRRKTKYGKRLLFHLSVQTTFHHKRAAAEENLVVCKIIDKCTVHLWGKTGRSLIDLGTKFDGEGKHFPYRLGEKFRLNCPSTIFMKNYVIIKVQQR